MSNPFCPEKYTTLRVEMQGEMLQGEAQTTVQTAFRSEDGPSTSTPSQSPGLPNPFYWQPTSACLRNPFYWSTAKAADDLPPAAVKLLNALHASDLDKGMLEQRMEEVLDEVAELMKQQFTAFFGGSAAWETDEGRDDDTQLAGVDGGELDILTVEAHCT